jgi:2-polyprenyl-6-methoxyphenol hydroxylase-like FAD-dependent oxidoreductase
MNAVIAGGGVAGLSLALRLLRQGKQVTVVENQKQLSNKVCGEGLLPFGVQLLSELGLREAAEANGRLFSGIAYFCGPRRVVGNFKEGTVGLGITRSKVHRLLLEACEKFPHFRMVFGTRIQDVVLNGDQQLYGADGVNSPIARQNHWFQRPGKRVGIRFHLKVAPPDRVHVHFFREGEIYLTPVGKEELSVAMLLERRCLPSQGKEIKAWAKNFFRARFPEYDCATILDYATRAPIVSHNYGSLPEVHLLGDAYQTFDPITGAGMSFALLCSREAARHCDDPSAYYAAMKVPERSIREFTNMVLMFRGGGLRTSLMLRQLAKSPAAFDHILDLHDGAHRIYHLGWRHTFALLRP